jgi:TonB family protein
MGVCLLAVSAVLHPVSARAQEELTRKVKIRVAPVYPDIARRMHITGTVRVEVVITPNGALRSTKVLGGHPLLVTAVTDALKKWKFDSGPEETTGQIEFKFQAQE